MTNSGGTQKRVCACFLVCASLALSGCLGAGSTGWIDTVGASETGPILLPYPGVCTARFDVGAEGAYDFENTTRYDTLWRPIEISFDHGADGTDNARRTLIYGPLGLVGEVFEGERERQSTQVGYDDKGLRVSDDIDRGADGSVDTQVVRDYDDEGRMVLEARDYDADGVMDQRSERQYDDRDRLVRLEEGEFVTVFLYDDAGRLVTERTTHEGGAWRTIAHRYEAGLRTETTHHFQGEQRQRIEYTYDRQGRLIEELYDADGVQGLSHTLRTRVAYLPHEMSWETWRGEHRISNQTVDYRGPDRALDWEALRHGPGDVDLRNTYVWDTVGNLVAITSDYHVDGWPDLEVRFDYGCWGSSAEGGVVYEEVSPDGSWGRPSD